MRRRLINLLAAAALAAFPVVAHAQAPNGQGRPSDTDVREYWSAGRMDNAIPRDYYLNQRGQVERAPVPTAKPGGGGGSTGSSSTGTSWTGDQSVAWATGRVYFTMSGTDYTCSGTVVSDNDSSRIVVLTAGHCAYDEGANAFATNWMFIPNYDLRDAFFVSNGGCATFVNRCWVANGLVAAQRWADGTASAPNFGSDFAFAFFTDSDELAGYNQHPNSYALTTPYAAAPTSVYAFGYPASGKYNGSDLVYCNGATIQDPYAASTDWGIACDMNGGSSGGGWLADFTSAPHLVSVNSYRYQGGPYKNYMFGPLFNGETTALLTTALAASGNQLVSYP